MTGSHRVTISTFGKLIPLAVALMAANNAAADDSAMRLHMTGQGRFTYFADLDSLTKNNAGQARLRSLQLSEPMQIGAHIYLGGWSWWRIDCAAGTAQRLDFASVRDDGTVGPPTPMDGQALEMAPGGDAWELGAVACGTEPPRVDATGLSEAIRLSADQG